MIQKYVTLCYNMYDSKQNWNGKVREHCHHTVKYRGAAHSFFNLKFNVPNKIHVVFHNGKTMIIIFYKKN